MARHVVIPLVLVAEVSEGDDSTSREGIFSKPATQKYAEGWEALWGATADGMETEALTQRHPHTLN